MNRILLESKEHESVRQHLVSRGMDPDKINVIIDEDSNTATFLLYNLSGEIVGYQRYTPGASKKNSNPTLARYFTRVTKEGKTKKAFAWGLESINDSTRILYVTEGIFDATKIQNSGRSAIAILTSNPKFIGEWLSILPYYIVGIQDRDEEIQKGWNFLDGKYVVPEPYKDLGEMPQSEVNTFMEKIENG